MVEEHFLTKDAGGGLMRKIDPTSICKDTWVLLDLDTKSPIVLVDGRHHLLKPGWIVADGKVHGESFLRSHNNGIYRNINVLYDSLPNIRPSGFTSYRHVPPPFEPMSPVVFNETMTQIKCDGVAHHDWKTYDSGFSSYQYCSVCDRKAQ